MFTKRLRRREGGHHLFIDVEESSIKEPRRRRTSELHSKKFIALALKARLKWIYKYFIQKENSDVSRQEIKKPPKCPLQIKCGFLAPRGFCGFASSFTRLMNILQGD